MKKMTFIALLGLIAAGAYFGYRMAKGDGGWLSACCGWGGGKDPWSSYTPPAGDAGA